MRRSCRLSTSLAYGSRMRSSTSCVPSKTRTTLTRTGRWTRPATSTGLDFEFVIADLALVDRRLDRLKTSGRHGTPAERESNEREEVVLVRLKEALEDGRPIRDVELDDDEEKAIRGFRFLSQKPVLVLLNVGEGELAAGRGARRAGRRRLRPPQAIVDSPLGADRDGARRAGAGRGGRCSWRSSGSPSRASIG